jgi:hypothetical protein
MESRGCRNFHDQRKRVRNSTCQGHAKDISSVLLDPVYAICMYGRNEDVSSSHCQQKIGARGSVVVKALCYKPEGPGFETR